MMLMEPLKTFCILKACVVGLIFMLKMFSQNLSKVEIIGYLLMILECFHLLLVKWTICKDF